MARCILRSNCETWTATATAESPGNGRTLTATAVIKMLLARGADPNQFFDKKPPQIQTQEP